MKLVKIILPDTKALSQFNLSSFHDNPSLCGSQIKLPCSNTQTFLPSKSPKSSISAINAFPPIIASNHKKNGIKRLIAIVAGSIAGVLVLSICLALAVCLVFGRKRQIVAAGSRTRGVGVDKSLEEGGCGGGGSGVEVGGGGGGGGGTKGGFSWEGKGLGKLVFCGCVGEMYSLDELLKASAETLGRGTVASTYKAVMESGFIVTVKRLKESTQPGVEEFNNTYLVEERTDCQRTQEKKIAGPRSKKEERGRGEDDEGLD